MGREVLTDELERSIPERLSAGLGIRVKVHRKPIVGGTLSVHGGHVPCYAKGGAQYLLRCPRLESKVQKEWTGPLHTVSCPRFLYLLAFHRQQRSDGGGGASWHLHGVSSNSVLEHETLPRWTLADD